VSNEQRHPENVQWMGGRCNLWDVENKGVTPDIVVEQTPAGHVSQLERAVQEALKRP